VVWQRERRVGVGVLPYVASKVIVLGGFIALQCAILSAFLYAAIGMGAYEFSLPHLMATTVLTGFVGISIGLFVSSVWTSSEAAVGTLPLLLIPQITFSSIMVSVRDMGPLAQAFTWVTIQRYTFDAIIKCGNLLAVSTYKKGEWEQQPINGSLWKLGLKMSDAADDMGFSHTTLSAMLAAVVMVMLSATTTAVWLRGRKGG
jgi:DMSO/TMAO reductase YedYZ heme-binding membrane subunit